MACGSEPNSDWIYFLQCNTVGSFRHPFLPLQQYWQIFHCFCKLASQNNVFFLISVVKSKLFVVQMLPLSIFGPGKNDIRKNNLTCTTLKKDIVLI